PERRLTTRLDRMNRSNRRCDHRPKPPRSFLLGE
ncbi:hypothetical protein D020_0037B, partial [Vibrio parahaemolyticus SBR10290]